jgi:hypothetical protein
MPITRTAMIDDDGSGTTGTILNNTWKQELYNQIDALVSLGGVGFGVWQATPFNAADYSAGGSMTWTVGAGNVLMNRYTVIGKTLIWNVYIGSALTGGTPSNALLVKLPGGFTARSANSGTAATSQLYDGIHQPGFVTVSADGLRVMIQKTTEANVSLGLSYIRFSLALEIN